MTLAILNFTRPVLDAICLIERSDSEKTRMLTIQDSDGLYDVVRLI